MKASEVPAALLGRGDCEVCWNIASRAGAWGTLPDRVPRATAVIGLRTISVTGARSVVNKAVCDKHAVYIPVSDYTDVTKEIAWVVWKDMVWPS